MNKMICVIMSLVRMLYIRIWDTCILVFEMHVSCVCQQIILCQIGINLLILKCLIGTRLHWGV